MVSKHLRRFGFYFLSVGAIASAQIAPARIQSSDRRPADLFTSDSLSLLLDDTRFVLTSPLHWDGQDWAWVAGAAGLVGVAGTFDGQIKTESQQDRTPRQDRLTHEFQKFGSEYSWVVLAGLVTYGSLRDDREAKATAFDGVAASVIASGIITPALKFAVGRERPNRSEHTLDVQPFSGEYSFPSGHATQAFALATVISEHYSKLWVQVLAYGSAGVVGYSRIQQNSHYASDVVAGAVIGTVVAHAIVKHNNTPDTHHAMSMAPFIDGKATGLMFWKSF